MDEITVSRLTIDIGASSDSARREINRVTDALSRLRGNAKTKIKVDSEDVDKAHKKVGLLANTLNSLKRIAFYRVIRSAIKAVGEAFSEGAENAYWYSKTMGDSTKYIAEAYDTLSSKSSTMSNQLGAAWATLKATITPFLVEVINLATAAASALTQFFAALGGKGKYLKAIDYSKEWADTTKRGAGAAKEWRNQLMGFDEINRLEEPSKGGGGSGALLPDYANMFEEANVENFSTIAIRALSRITDWFKKIDWQDLGREVWEGIKNIFTDDGQANSVASAFFETIGAAFGAVSGFVWGFLKSAAEDLIKQFKENIKDYDGDGRFGLYDFLSAIWITGQDILTWVDQSIVKPFIRGFWKGFDGSEREPLTVNDFITKVLGLPTNEEWLDIGRNLADALVQGWTDFWDEVGYMLFGKPISEIVENVKAFLGIHSPSTVFQDIGKNMVQGLWDGIQEKWDGFTGWFESKWNSFKSWWQGLSLGSFDFKTPHLRVDWEAIPGDSVLARFLGFTSIPHIGIDWYAKGGIVDGATLIGAGEAGKEAIIPLERNTEWISKVAAEMNAQQARQDNGYTNDRIVEEVREGVFEAVLAAMSQTSDREQPTPVFKFYLDGKEIRARQKQLEMMAGV